MYAKDSCTIGCGCLLLFSAGMKSLEMPIINEKSLDTDRLTMYNSKRLFAYYFSDFSAGRSG
ncbi:hypothetical protein [Ruminococcus albus]|uniref:hypothetical protein n=1 Tax=Ruminococcus albus TaxID=1264 RepID=UPI0004BB3880|nr:hypothetical protein [Ruminococcus albus]